MFCCQCVSQMSCCVDTNRNDCYRWRCLRKTSTSVSSVSMSIRHGSFFRQSNLNFMEVLFFTYSYNLVRCIPVLTIEQEVHFCSAYRNIESHGYTHQTVNHTIGFVVVRPGAHTNKIQSTWRRVSLQGRTYKGKAFDQQPGSRTLILPSVVLAADFRTINVCGEQFAYTSLPKQ